MGSRGACLPLCDAERARGLISRSLAIEEAAHGRDHIFTSASCASLGAVHVDLGDAAAAMPLLQPQLF